MGAGTSGRFRFFLIAFALVSTPVEALADLVGGRTEDRKAGTILEPGQINPRTVKLGAFAVVIHGKGGRHPASGEWEHLETARGYIQAIGGDTLTLGPRRGMRSKPIALERIQTLVMIRGTILKEELRKTTPEAGADRWRPFSPASRRPEGKDSTKVELVDPDWLTETPDSLSKMTKKQQQMGTGNRIALKLVAGTLLGSVSGLPFTSILLTGWDSDSDGIGTPSAVIFGWSRGYTLGAGVAVTLVDPHDNFLPTLTGSVAGAAIGSMAFNRYPAGWSAICYFFVCPVIGSVIGSELWRDVPGSPRFSTGLISDPQGHFPGLAMLFRF